MMGVVSTTTCQVVLFPCRALSYVILPSACSDVVISLYFVIYYVAYFAWCKKIIFEMRWSHLNLILATDTLINMFRLEGLKALAANHHVPTYFNGVLAMPQLCKLDTTAPYEEVLTVSCIQAKIWLTWNGFLTFTYTCAAGATSEMVVQI